MWGVFFVSGSGLWLTAGGMLVIGNVVLTTRSETHQPYRHLERVPSREICTRDWAGRRNVDDWHDGQSRVQKF